jgi:organic radical activating enzyme
MVNLLSFYPTIGVNMNNQPPLPVVKKEANVSSNDAILVHSIFHTIQGEGPFSGTPAFFIRLGGCNLQCPRCDTDYSHNSFNMSVIGVGNKLNQLRIKNGKTKLVVITGGEPFRQQIKPLIDYILGMGFWIQIESNGTLPLQGIHFEKNIAKRKGVYLVVAPKTAKIHRQALAAACAFKYVVSSDVSLNEFTGLPEEVLGMKLFKNGQYPKPRKDALIYIQPESASNEFDYAENLATATQICLKHGYILSLQIHKIIGVE